MTEDTKKVEETELAAKAAELSEQDLNKVAGGTSDYRTLHGILPGSGKIP